MTLELTQKWFASIIVRPIDVESKMEMTSPSGRSMVDEAKEFIRKSPTLQSHERIELYCQQYWWRLLSTLHEDFPFLLRLFGYTDFNMSIGMPYLTAYPPNHWSLSALGSHLVSWLQENYLKEDRQIVIGSALIDLSYAQSFVSASLPKVTNPEGPITLQPHMHLMHFHLPLFELREAFLKESPEFWEDHPFPTIEKQGATWYVLARNQNNRVVYWQVEEEEFILLKKIAEGTTLSDLCEWLEGQPKSVLEKASENLTSWFERWTRLGLLAEKLPTKP